MILKTENINNLKINSMSYLHKDKNIPMIIL